MALLKIGTRSKAKKDKGRKQTGYKANQIIIDESKRLDDKLSEDFIKYFLDSCRKYAKPRAVKRG